MASYPPNWYRISEIPYGSFVACLQPLYRVLETGHITKKSNPDVFLRSIVAAHQGVTVAELDAAKRRFVYEKNLSMKMGDFHEELMGKFTGYNTLPTGHSTGVDVERIDGTELIEVKNAQNTMNAGHAKSVIATLRGIAEGGVAAILVLVNINTKKPRRFQAPNSVTVLSGREMYARLSGRDTFFDDLNATLAETFARFKTWDELRGTVVAETPLPQLA